MKIKHTDISMKKILMTIAVIVICISGYFIFRPAKKETFHLPTVPVKVSHPLLQSLPTLQITTGFLVAKESANITPLAAGYIRSIAIHEGELVQQGAILFQLDNDTQRNALASAKASAALSDLQFARDQNLLKRGFITQETFFSAKVTNQQNQAALETAQTNLDARTITAPFTGTIGAITTSVGDYVTPGMALTALVDNAHLRATYTLPVKFLNQIKINDPVTIAAPSRVAKASAVVSYVAPSVDQNTQTIAIHARIDNSNNLFKPGEYVKVEQTIGHNQTMLLIPEQALIASINGYAVFIAKQNQAIRVTVTIGDRINGNVVIKNGLTSLDNVIITGQDQVKDHQPIQVTP